MDARRYRANVNPIGGMIWSTSLTTMKFAAHTTMTPTTLASMRRRSVGRVVRRVTSEGAAPSPAEGAADTPTPAGGPAGVWVTWSGDPAA